MKVEARLTRRDFLKVVKDIGSKVPVLPFIDKLTLSDSSEAPKTVDWFPTQNVDIDTYFKLADRWSQQWLNQYMPYGDNALYTLSVSASVSISQLEPDTLQYGTNYPVAEMFKQSIFVKKAGIFENNEGRIIQAYIDPRVVSDALEKFSHTSLVDFFLYRVAVVPQEVAAKISGGRYIEYNKMPSDVEQYIFPGPLAQPESDPEPYLTAYHINDNSLPLLFSNVIRVTGKGGMPAYYTANIRNRDQVT